MCQTAVWFEKTRLPGQATNHCKMMVMAALTNLFLARKRLLAMAAAWHHRSSVTTHCFYDARDIRKVVGEQKQGLLTLETLHSSLHSVLPIFMPGLKTGSPPVP